MRNSLVNQRLGSFRVVDGLSSFRGHVVFVVLRQHLVSIKNAVTANVTLRHTASAFLEEVGKNAFVDYRNTLGCICYGKSYSQPVIIAFEAFLFDQATNSECSPDGRLFSGHLRRTEEEVDIILERI